MFIRFFFNNNVEHCNGHEVASFYFILEKLLFYIGNEKGMAFNTFILWLPREK